MKEALKAIASFPDEKQMFDYCKANGIRFNELEPPYITMAKIAAFASNTEK